jgi:hypothetical protein
MANIRSPVHAICELRLPGRGSASARLLPIPYAREGGDVVVLPIRAAGGAWWQHFIEPHPVEIRLNGAWRAGVGRTVPATHPGRPALNLSVHCVLSYLERDGPGAVTAKLPRVVGAQLEGQATAGPGRSGRPQWCVDALLAGDRHDVERAEKAGRRVGVIIYQLFRAAQRSGITVDELFALTCPCMHSSDADQATGCQVRLSCTVSKARPSRIFMSSALDRTLAGSSTIT